MKLSYLRRFWLFKLIKILLVNQSYSC